MVNHCGQADLCQLLVADDGLPTVRPVSVALKLYIGYLLLLQMANLGLQLCILLLCSSCRKDMASVLLLKLQLLLLQTSILFVDLRSKQVLLAHLAYGRAMKALGKRLRVRRVATTFESELEHLLASILLPGQLSHKVSVSFLTKCKLVLNSLQLCLHYIQVSSARIVCCFPAKDFLAGLTRSEQCTTTQASGHDTSRTAGV